jgi:hypothetical protein
MMICELVIKKELIIILLVSVIHDKGRRGVKRSLPTIKY